jgi:uncharacterized protein YcaQ
MKLTLPQARHLTLHHQLYRFADTKGKAGVLDVIKTLSYIQIDTISVIERAHHHTLYNRVNDYQHHYLHDLQAKDKTIWEHWGHAASFLPMDDYPFYKTRMQNFPNGNWEKRFWELHKDMAKPILDRIRKEGPLSTKHFEDTRIEKSKEIWSNLKPAKIMLELLMWKGELIVTARDKFQRVYDLTERVLPHHASLEIPSEQTRAEFMITRTLQAHGIATEWDICNHITLARKPSVIQALDGLLQKKVIRKVHLDTVKDDYYILADTELNFNPDRAVTERVRILSPFDNTVIMRPRLAKIFNFEYALECYVTPAKRLYGYWNCPILWQDELVGMLDPKAERKQKKLVINSIFIRKNIWKSKVFQAALDAELYCFAGFNGCENISIEQVNLI